MAPHCIMCVYFLTGDACCPWKMVLGDLRSRMKCSPSERIYDYLYHMHKDTTSSGSHYTIIISWDFLAYLGYVNLSYKSESKV